MQVEFKSDGLCTTITEVNLGRPTMAGLDNDCFDAVEIDTRTPFY